MGENQTWALTRGSAGRLFEPLDHLSTRNFSVCTTVRLDERNEVQSSDVSLFQESMSGSIQGPQDLQHHATSSSRLAGLSLEPAAQTTPWCDVSGNLNRDMSSKGERIREAFFVLTLAYLTLSRKQSRRDDIHFTDFKAGKRTLRGL